MSECPKVHFVALRFKYINRTPLTICQPHSCINEQKPGTITIRSENLSSQYRNNKTEIQIIDERPCKIQWCICAVLLLNFLHKMMGTVNARCQNDE